MKPKAILLSIVFLLAPAALAVDLLVPDQYPTIQAAIDAAHGGDVVVVAPGTYGEYINFKGKAITVRSTAPCNWETIQKTVINVPHFVGESSDGIVKMASAGYHLMPDSPCVNAGDPNIAAEGRMDVDGQARIMGGRIDIGADEVIPEMRVNQPASGEIWSAGSQHEIRWSSSGIEGTAGIRFSQDAGKTTESVCDTTANTGTFLWQLPEGVDSNQCIVSVIPTLQDPTLRITPSGLFTIRPDATGPDLQSQWPSLGGDYGRSGQGQDRGPSTLAVKWRFETGSAVVNSVTLGSEGRIHIACEDGKVYTLGPNGSPLWSLDVNTPLRSAPSIGTDGSLFVGSRNGSLYAIGPEGRLRWTHGTGGEIYSSPAVGPNGNIYVGSTDGTLYALGKDGTDLWRFTTKGSAGLSAGAIFASPSIAADGTVYVAGVYDPNLYALNPTDGRVQWVCSFDSNTADPNSQQSGRGLFASPVIGKDGTIYQTLLYDSHLYAIEPAGGKVLWSTDLLASPSIDTKLKDLDADGWSEPVLGPDGTIYVALDDSYLRAVDPNGRIKWAIRLGDVRMITLTVGRNGLIYAACDDGVVRVIDPSGAEVHRLEIGGWPAFPIITAENTLIVTDSQDYSVFITGDKNKVWSISSRR